MFTRWRTAELPQQGNLGADHPPQRGTTDLGADQGGIGQGSDLGVDPPERDTADLGAGQGGVGQGSDLGVDQPGDLGTSGGLSHGVAKMRHPEAGDHFSGQRGWTWILPRRRLGYGTQSSLTRMRSRKT